MKNFNTFRLRPILLRSCTLTLVVLGFGMIHLASAQGPMRFSSGLTNTQSQTYSNLIKFSLASPSISGDEGQFSQRHRIPGATYGGLEALHLEQFVGASGILTIDGRAIIENDEVRFKARYEEPDIGYARIGVDNFRIWYDGDGGYFPATETRFAPNEDILAMDRRETFAEAGLRIPGIPELTVKYSRQIRDGNKPSLAWGDATMPDDFGDRRNIVPAFWKSDEERNIVEGKIEHAIGKTNLQVGIRYETGDILNALNIMRRPGESNERLITENDIVDTKAFDVHAILSTRLTDRVSITTSYVYQDLENDLSGDRIYGSEYESVFSEVYPGRQRRDHGFLDLTGMTNRTLRSGRVNLLLTPIDGLIFIPGVRLDRQEIDGFIQVTDTEVERDLTFTFTPLENTSDRTVDDLSGSLEFRYTAIPNFLVYARGEWLDREGSIFEQEILAESGEIEFLRESDDTRTAHKYRAGASWYPSSQVKLGFQAFTRKRTVEYDHLVDETGPDTYPSFLRGQVYETNDINASLRLRPDPRVSLTARVHLRNTTVDAESTELASAQSSEFDSQIVSGSVSWTPMMTMFVQGTVSYTKSNLKTPVNGLTGEDQFNVVLETDNDYMMAGLMSALAVSQKADIEVQYFYYKADNFVDNSEFGLPYDVGAEEHGMSAGLLWYMQPDLQLSARYYHFTNRDETFGSLEDYDLDMVFVGVQYRF